MSLESNDALFCRSAAVPSLGISLTENNNNISFNKGTNNTITKTSDHSNDILFVSSTM